MPHCRGNIIWFNRSMGFGFIQREGGPDVFCHRAALQIPETTPLEDGSEVEFDLSGPEGRHAENVILRRA